MCYSLRQITLPSTPNLNPLRRICPLRQLFYRLCQQFPLYVEICIVFYVDFFPLRRIFVLYVEICVLYVE